MAGVDTVFIFIVIGAIIVLGALAYGVSLVGGGRNRGIERQAPPAHEGLPGEDLDREPPAHATDVVAPPETPGGPAEVEIEVEEPTAPTAPTLERP